MRKTLLSKSLQFKFFFIYNRSTNKVFDKFINIMVFTELLEYIKFVIVVHVSGRSAFNQNLMSLINQNNLIVIEDAAEASQYRKVDVGQGRQSQDAGEESAAAAAGGTVGGPPAALIRGVDRRQKARGTSKGGG